VRAGIRIRGVDDDRVDRTPSVSAQICAITVFNPCPRSTEDSVTTKFPVVVACTSAWLGSPPRFMPVG